MTVDTSKTKFTLRHNILKRYFADTVTVTLSGNTTYTLLTHGLGWVPNVFVEYITNTGKKQLVSNTYFSDTNTLTNVGDEQGEILVDSTTVKFNKLDGSSRSCVFHVKVYIDE